VCCVSAVCCVCCGYVLWMCVVCFVCVCVFCVCMCVVCVLLKINDNLHIDRVRGCVTSFGHLFFIGHRFLCVISLTRKLFKNLLPPPPHTHTNTTTSSLIARTHLSHTFDTKKRSREGVGVLAMEDSVQYISVQEHPPLRRFLGQIVWWVGVCSC